MSSAAPASGQAFKACPVCSYVNELANGHVCQMCGYDLSRQRQGVSAISPAFRVKKESKLNPSQEAAVYTNGHLVVTACPGSGKTFMLMKRAVRKLQESRKAAGAMVTFTKDAAKEIEGRVLTEYPEAGGRIICGTFHSLCLRQLRDAGRQINLISEHDRNDLISTVLRDLKSEADDLGTAGEVLKEMRLENAILAVDGYKTQVHPNVAASTAGGMVYMRYQQTLSTLKKMDFSDILIQTVRDMIIGKIPPLPIEWLMVDEAQDTDEVQYAWIKAHRDQGIEVTMVGDDDQSIYGFRKSMGYRCLSDFHRSSNARLITLDTTYRCANEILMPAGRLIAKNTERIPKVLRTENMRPGSVHVHTSANLEGQIRDMVKTIMKSPDPPCDWGILTRNNRIAMDIERTVRAYHDHPGISDTMFLVERAKGESFWDQKGPAIMLGMMKSLWDNSLAHMDIVLRLLGCSDGRMRQLHNALPFEGRGTLAKGHAMFAAHAQFQKEAQFWKLTHEWRQQLHKGNIELVSKGMASFLRQIELVDKTAKNKGLIQAMIDRQIEAATHALITVWKYQSKQSYGMRLVNLMREQSSDTSDDISDETRLKTAKLMTMHGSKGLEFKNVFLLGCDAGVIPPKECADEEEERRLFYVAMTRAKQTLHIAHTADTQSPFIAEAGIKRVSQTG